MRTNKNKYRVVSQAPETVLAVNSLNGVQEDLSVLPFVRLRESIRYEDHEGQYHECFHRRHRIVSHTGTLGYAPGSPGYLPVSWLFQFARPLFSHNQAIEFADVLMHEVTGLQHEKRWEQLRFVSNDPEFALGVFIAELKEMKRIIPGLLTHMRRIVRLIARSRGRALTFGDLVAGGWLDWSFGTGAFIRDLIKLIGLFFNLGEKYDKFISGMGEPRGAHHLMKAQHLATPFRDTPLTYHLLGGDWLFKTEWRIGTAHVREPYSCLTARYRYFSQAMTQPFGKAKFMAQKLGVNFNPAIPWNLIPLSFCIDWVIPVGNWLERFSIDNLDLSLIVDDAGYGSRVTLAKDFYVRSAPSAINDWHLVGSEEVRIYSRARIRARDVSPKPLTIGKVTLNKVLSASALLWTFTVGNNRR